jgi:hypothetical protein
MWTRANLGEKVVREKEYRSAIAVWLSQGTTQSEDERDVEKIWDRNVLSELRVAAE